MKKKVLLITLPFLMCLSGCSNAPIFKRDHIIEDTLAHEEIFGDLPTLDARMWQLSPKRALPVDVDLYKPVIGYQRKTNNDGTYSVRFVAAMQSATDSAVWTRSVHNLAGTLVRSKSTQDVTDVYRALNNNGNPAYANEVQAEDGSYPYDCFAVYCLLNIPSSYSDYYVDAYITVNDGGDEVTSDVGSYNVLDGSKKFKYTLSGGSRYVASINGVLRESDPHEGNHLVLNSISLAEDDTLEAYYLNTSTLTYTRYGYSALGRSNADFVEGSNGELKAKYASEQNVFFNNDNNFFFEKKIYLQTPSWWKNDGCDPKLELNDTDNLNNEDENKYKRYSMIYLGALNSGDLQYSAFVDSSFYESVQFYRYASGYNQNYTGYKTIPTDGKNMYTRYEGVDDTAGAWSIRGDEPPVIDNSGFAIDELTEPVEIHTAQQKTYLEYDGDYSTMPTEQYPDGSAHLSDSNAVTVTWDYTAPYGKTVDHFSIVFGQKSDLSDGYQVNGTAAETISFYNPYLRRNYYKLIATFTDLETEESEIHSFYVDATAPRNLTIGGMTNCRDIGGKVTEDGGLIKQGLIYRTSGYKYDYSTEITTAGRTEMLNHLRVKTEINISNNESNNVALSGTTVKNCFMDYGGSSSHHFSRNAESLKNFFETVADSNNYPIFFHCRIGTDRTGLCAIMLSGLLGVPVNQIYQDYLFSNFGKIGEKRYIGDLAGQDNIQNYMNEISQMSGTTFKNKVYNTLLSIGISRRTLDTVIANLTEGTLAQGNDAGQVLARGDVLHGSGVSVTEDNSERNNPDNYFTLNDSTKAVSHTFTAPNNYTGQVVAYLGNSNHSSSMFIDDALVLTLDGHQYSIRNVDYATAGMGNCSGRINYYPVILANLSISAGEHTISLVGTSNTMNVGGLYIFNAALDADTSFESGEDMGLYHVHNYHGSVLTPATCTENGVMRYTCSLCDDYYDEDIPMVDHDYDSGIVITSPTHKATGLKRYTCSVCGNIHEEILAKIPHEWEFVSESVAGDGTEYSTYVCDCGAKKIEIAALSGVFAAGSSNKSGTPDGLLKLSSNGNSISYTFDIDLGSDPSATATLYQRGCIDVWGSGTGSNASLYAFTGGKTSPGTYTPDFEIKFNGSETAVDVTGYQNKKYSEIFPAGSGSYSPIADVESGVVTLNNGTNTFSYKRVASYNLLIGYFVLVIE